MESTLTLDISLTDQFIQQYNFSSLGVQENVCHINIVQALSHIGEEMIVIDIGADKVFIALVTIESNGPKQTSGTKLQHFSQGPILPFIVSSIKQLTDGKKIMKIGISAHGQIVNHKHVKHIAPELGEELRQAGYENFLCGYIRHMVGIRHVCTMFNDAVSGGAFAFGINRKIRPETEHVVYFIVGGGVGGCYIDEGGNVSSAEPGHINWLPYSDDPQPEACQQAGAKYCAEVYSKGPYLETKLSQKYIGKEIPGPEINGLLEKGDENARLVYEHGSRNAASVVLGILHAFHLLSEEKMLTTTIVTHGGVADNVLSYNDMLKAHLLRYIKTKFQNVNDIPVISSKQLLAGLGDNAGALGAAILAF